MRFICGCDSLFLALLLLGGCDIRRGMCEISSGLSWQLFKPGHSRLTWHDEVVAEGDIGLEILPFGVLGRIRGVDCSMFYVDLLDGIVSSSASMSSSLPAHGGHAVSEYCAETVMGPYGAMCRTEFLEAVESLRRRLANRRSGEVDEWDAKALWRRVFAFDYLGMEGTVYAPLRRMDANPAELETLLADYFERMEFQWMLEALEAEFQKGGALAFRSSLGRIADFLGSLGMAPSAGRRRLLCGLIRSLEYAFVRMAFGKASGLTLSSNDVVDALPDSLFLENETIAGISYHRVSGVRSDLASVDMDTAVDMGRTLVFRDMLVVGIEIERWRKENGRLPNAIAALDISSERRVRQFVYSTDGGTWRLFHATAVKSEDPAPPGAYLPFIERVGCLPKTAFLWLSTDFADRRRALYERGVLNEEYPEWGCRMADGRVEPISCPIELVGDGRDD